MSIATFQTTTLGGAAAAVVDALAPHLGDPPPGVERHLCADDVTWHANRGKDVTASVAAALLNAHPWVTPYSLFMQKTGVHSEEVEDTGPVRRGRLLEPVAVQLIREERPGWKIIHNDGKRRTYFRDPAARIGATPDVIAFCPERGGGIVQIKSVGSFTFKQKWMVDGEVEPPVWIAVQAIIEATLTGAKWAAVAPLVVDDSGVTMPVIDVPIHAGVMSKIRAAVKDFWDRVERNDPPPPDYARDGAIISALYADDDGGEVDLSENNRIMEAVHQRKFLKEREADGAAAAKERKALDAEIIHALGNATRGRLADGRIIEAKTIRRGAYEVAPTSYRTVKVKG